MRDLLHDILAFAAVGLFFATVAVWCVGLSPERLPV